MGKALYKESVMDTLYYALGLLWPVLAGLSLAIVPVLVVHQVTARIIQWLAPRLWFIDAPRTKIGDYTLHFGPFAVELDYTDCPLSIVLFGIQIPF